MTIIKITLWINWYFNVYWFVNRKMYFNAYQIILKGTLSTSLNSNTIFHRGHQFYLYYLEGEKKIEKKGAEKIINISRNCNTIRISFFYIYNFYRRAIIWRNQNSTLKSFHCIVFREWNVCVVLKNRNYITGYLSEMTKMHINDDSRI